MPGMDCIYTVLTSSSGIKTFRYNYHRKGSKRKIVCFHLAIFTVVHWRQYYPWFQDLGLCADNSFQPEGSSCSAVFMLHSEELSPKSRISTCAILNQSAAKIESTGNVRTHFRWLLSVPLLRASHWKIKSTPSNLCSKWSPAIHPHISCWMRIL